MRRGIFNATWLALVCACLSLPAAASAGTICVAPATGCDQQFGEADLQAALNAAASTTDPDTVRLGASTYEQGPYAILGGVSESIVGAGAGQTIIAPPANAASETMLQLLMPPNPVPASVVSDLSILVPANTAAELDIGLSTMNVDAQRVVVESAADHSLGVRLSGGSFSDGTVTMPVTQENGLRGIYALDENSAVSGSTVSAQTGIEYSSTSGTTLTVSRTRVNAYDRGIQTDSGDVVVTNSLVDLGSVADARGIVTENGNASSTQRDLTLRHVTIVGGGAGSQGLRVAATGGAVQNVDATLADSVISGPSVTIVRRATNGNSADVVSRYSAYDPALVDELNTGTGTGDIDEDGTLVTAPAAFAGPGDFRPAAGSPLIDAGNPLPAGPPTDLAGAPRVQDGDDSGLAARDIGAYEFADTVGPPVFIDGPVGVTADTTPTFVFNVPTKYLTATYVCRYDGEAFRPCSVSSGFQGEDTPAQPLAEGPHTFEVRASDELGNAGPPATRSIVVDTSSTRPPDVTPPRTRIVSKPKPTRSTKVRFRFNSNETGSTFECKLDKGRFRPCRNPRTYKNLKPGKHVFRVRATDPSGNLDRTPAKRRFRILP